MKEYDKNFPDRKSRPFVKSFFILLLLLALIAGAIYLLNPEILNNSDDSIATMKMVKNKVSHKSKDSIDYTSASVGVKLQNGDEIFADVDSMAKVLFNKSKNIITIPSSSLIRIEDRGFGETVEIQKGDAQFFIPKGEVLSLKVGGKNLKLKGGKIDSNVSAKFKDGNLDLVVENGEVNLKQGKKEETLNKDNSKQLSISNNKTTDSVEITTPTTNQMIELWEGINLSWTGSQKIDVALSKFQDMREIEDQISFDSNDKKENWIPDAEEGKYYLKVNDKVIPIKIVNTEDIANVSPSDNRAFQIGRGQALTLEWDKIKSKKYKISVKNPQGVLTDYISESNKIAIDNATDGEYEWTISPLIGENKFMKKRKYYHFKLQTIGENKIVVIPNRTLFHISAEKVKLKWSGVANEEFLIKAKNSLYANFNYEKKLKALELDFPIPHPGRYEIEITSRNYPTIKYPKTTIDVVSPIGVWSKNLPKVIYAIDPKEKLKLNFKFNYSNYNDLLQLMKFQDKPGSPILYKSASALTNEISLTKYGRFCFMIKPSFGQIPFYVNSDNYCVNFARKAAFDSIEKPKDTILEYIDGDAGAEQYRIRIPKIAKAKEYYFFVYKDADAKKVVFAKKTNAPEVIWKSGRTGLYYFRYKVRDERGHSSDYSPISKLIFPISPLSDWN